MHGSVNHDNEVKVSVKYQYLYDLVKNLGGRRKKGNTVGPDIPYESYQT